MPQIGLDTCSFKDKIAAKIEKIVQEAEKPQRKNANWGRGDARPCINHHGPCSPPWEYRGGSCLVTLSRSPKAAFWCMSGLHALPMLGHFGLLLLPSLIL